MILVEILHINESDQMAMPTTEFYFLRLLDRTKRLIREDVTANVHKATAAVILLENMISKMKDENEHSRSEMIMQYTREVNNLQMLIGAEKKSKTEEKLLEVEKIPKLFPEARVDVEKEPEPGAKRERESSQILRQRNTAVYREDLRKQLLQSTKTDQRMEVADEDELYRKHEALEEELATELYTMTRSLKKNMQVANAVIKDDNRRLVDMQSQMDKNTDALSAEGDRLEKHAYKCGFDCIRILLFVFIFYTFICMVIVMKFFPKKVTQ